MDRKWKRFIEQSCCKKAENHHIQNSLLRHIYVQIGCSPIIVDYSATATSKQDTVQWPNVLKAKPVCQNLQLELHLWSHLHKVMDCNVETTSMCVGRGLHRTWFGCCGYFLFKKGPPTGAKRVGAMTAQSQGNNDVVTQCGHSEYLYQGLPCSMCDRWA